MQTIIIAGGTGFLGTALQNYLSHKGYLVKIITRNPKRKNEVYWDAKSLNSSWITHLEKTTALINLTGKSINCRFTSKNKQAIINSRIAATTILGEAINRCENPPKIWMNSSTTSLYEESFATKRTEFSTELGTDFEAQVAKAWEAAFYKDSTPKTRKIVMRTAVILGKNGGAFPTLKKLTKLGLGGKQGSGKQKFSWMHLQDFTRAVGFLIDTKNASGAFNFCAPNPVSNANVMQELRKAMHLPIGIPSPKFAVQIGAFFMHNEPELILKSRNVIPFRLEQEGFIFKFPTIHLALQDLIHYN